MRPIAAKYSEYCSRILERKNQENKRESSPTLRKTVLEHDLFDTGEEEDDATGKSRRIFPSFNNPIITLKQKIASAHSTHLERLLSKEFVKSEIILNRHDSIFQSTQSRCDYLATTKGDLVTKSFTIEGTLRDLRESKDSKDKKWLSS